MRHSQIKLCQASWSSEVGRHPLRVALPQLQKGGQLSICEDCPDSGTDRMTGYLKADGVFEQVIGLFRAFLAVVETAHDHVHARREGHCAC